MNTKNDITLINTRHRDIISEVYKGLYTTILDISTVQGIHTICSKETLEDIRSLINEECLEPIGFLGSGNFHYLTYMLLQRYLTPLTLVVFDHHNDAGYFPYNDFLSCGSWIVDAVHDFSHLQKVYIVGAATEEATWADSDSHPKIEMIAEKEMNPERLFDLAREIPTKDVYFSIDRDILTDKEIRTNWDQGNVSLKSLIEAVEIIAEGHVLIGADICGDLEWEYTSGFHYPMRHYRKQTYHVCQQLIEVLQKVMLSGNKDPARSVTE